MINVLSVMELLDIRAVKEMNCSRPLTTLASGNGRNWQGGLGQKLIRLS